MAWIALPLALMSFIILSTLVILGQRLIQELTRPGVSITSEALEWEHQVFPEAALEAPNHLQRIIPFQSVDGIALHGEFWAQDHCAPTIILSHGYRCPSLYFRSVAAVEYAHGANVFFFDYRGHGKSSYVPTTCGSAEVNDLLAALEVAAAQPETLCDQMYVHGFSMGAAVAFLLPPQANIAGIIADSSYARLDTMILPVVRQTLLQETAGWRGPARWGRMLIPVLAHLALFGGQILFALRYRRQLIARPDRSIGSHTTPVLLIHAQADPMTEYTHARQLVAAARRAGRAIHEYYTPSALHCGSYQYDPQHYIALLKEFVTLEKEGFQL